MELTYKKNQWDGVLFVWLAAPLLHQEEEHAMKDLSGIILGSH